MRASPCALCGGSARVRVRVSCVRQLILWPTPTWCVADNSFVNFGAPERSERVCGQPELSSRPAKVGFTPTRNFRHVNRDRLRVHTTERATWAGTRLPGPDSRSAFFAGRQQMPDNEHLLLDAGNSRMWVRAPIAYLRPPPEGESVNTPEIQQRGGKWNSYGCMEAEVQLPVRRVRRGEAEAEAMGPGYRAAADMLNGMRELFRCRDTRSLGAAELVDR
ncbi:hypothetical protein B0H13DRAFT_1887248 [Mycena leptocephala]|nr:hypothetical protein B0H13DRAFT_1887248 [Mycena leptocephala]